MSKTVPKRAARSKTTPYDVAEHLRTPEEMAAYLDAWLEEAPDDAAGYAHGLYANLRELDTAGVDVIVVERPPARAEWFAVLDRLTRAAAGSNAPERP